MIWRESVSPAYSRKVRRLGLADTGFLGPRTLRALRAWGGEEIVLSARP